MQYPLAIKINPHMYATHIHGCLLKNTQRKKVTWGRIIPQIGKSKKTERKW